MCTRYGGLPTELIHHIFDILHDDTDVATLKACSHVDRLFCTLSQMRLLSRVMLHQECIYPTIASRPTVITPAYSPSVHFLQVLDNSPHIARYIQSLTIQCDWITPGAKGADHWLRIDTALAVLLPRLTSLRRVSVSGDRNVQPLRHHQPRPWTTIFQGLAPVFANKRLTDLDVTGIGFFPVTLLWQCPSLKRLSISSLGFDAGGGDPRADERTPRPRLDYLHLEDLADLELDALADWFSSPSFPVSIGHLKELSVHPGGHIDLEDIALCSTWAKTVQVLRIHTESAGVSALYNTLNYMLQNQSAPIPNLQDMDSLERVVVDARFTVRTFHHRTLIDYFTTPLPWITRLVMALAVLPKITHIVLNLVFVNFPNELVELLSITWLDVAIALEKFSRTPKLILNITGLDPIGLAELQRSEFLVALVNRGIARYT